MNGPGLKTLLTRHSLMKPPKKKKNKKTNKQTEQSNKDKTTKHLTENLRIQEISKEGKYIYIYIYLQLKLTPSTVDKEKPFQ